MSDLDLDTLEETARVERWLPVVGFEGSYEVSDQGRVRSLDRILPDGREWRGRVMKLGGDRYLQVLLRGGVGRSGDRMCTVHQLVLQAFVGPRPEGYEALHGVGGHRDNRLSNLRWGSTEENIEDRHVQGEIARGVRNGAAKLTPDDVREIRDAISNGESQASVARRFQVSKSTVWRAVNTHWKEVQ